jgi:hypothetical protein
MGLLGGELWRKNGLHENCIIGLSSRMGGIVLPPPPPPPSSSSSSSSSSSPPPPPLLLRLFLRLFFSHSFLLLYITKYFLFLSLSPSLLSSLFYYADEKSKVFILLQGVSHNPVSSPSFLPHNSLFSPSPILYLQPFSIFPLFPTKIRPTIAPLIEKKRSTEKTSPKAQSTHMTVTWLFFFVKGFEQIFLLFPLLFLLPFHHLPSPPPNPALIIITKSSPAWQQWKPLEFHGTRTAWYNIEGRYLLVILSHPPIPI